MSHEGNNKSNGSDVGDILQAVEMQLQQLRTVQQNQEQDARALAERTKNLVEKEQAISERQRAVKAHVAKIEQERAAIESRRADLDQEVAAWNAAQQKRLDAERDRETQREMLEKELAERREGLDVAASSIDKLSARVSQLETDLNTAHERADEITTESLELLKTAEQERDQVRKELEELRARGTSDGEEMQRLQAKLDEAIALVQAQEATIVEQADRLKNASESSDEATEERLVELECELEAKQQEIADQRHKLEEQEQKLEEQAQKLEELQAAVENGESGSNDDQLEDLRRKAQRLATVAEHMKRRHARLKRARELVRRKRSGSRGQAAIESERRTALTKHLERQRRELLELKQNIALAERKMIRRWARPRSVIIVGWLLMLVLFSAAVGWFGADRYFPAVVSASVTTEMDKSFDGEIDENLDAKWKAWHTAFVESPEFIDTLSKRLNERQIIAYSSPEAVRDRLLRDLGIDEVEAGEITFTLAGSDRKTMLVFMDLFAATLARRSGKAHRGTEMPVASVRDTREETGEAFIATIGSIPLEDDRLLHAGPIAGIVFATLLMLIGVAYSKLVRAKREFDDSGDLFDALSEGKFSMPSA